MTHLHYASIPTSNRIAVRRSLLVIALGLQAFWILPALDGRVAAVIAGTPPPPSWHHNAYAGLEVVKSCTLLALALAGVRHVFGKR